MKISLLLIWLSVIAGVALAEDPKAPATPDTTASTTKGVTPPTPTPSTLPPSVPPATDFTPSEEVSRDLAVSFPVDI